MSVIRFTGSWFRSGCILLTLVAIQIFAGYGGSVQKEENNQTYGLIRVIAKMESGAVIYRDKTVSRSKVFEVNEFPGVFLDARGYVAAYLGSHWLKYSEPGATVSFWITWGRDSKLQAELVGIDERISIGVLKARGYNGYPVILGRRVKRAKAKLAAWQDQSIITASVKIIQTDPRESLPEEEIQAVELDTSRQSVDHRFSGAYLLDEPGRFLGFITRIQRTGLGRKALNFQVIPSTVVRKSLGEVLTSGGSISPGWLGVMADPNRKDVAVLDVRSGSPAAEVGLGKGDVILAVNGRPIETLLEFSKIIRWSGPGSRVDLKIARNEEVLNLEPVLAEWPASNRASLAWRVEVPRTWMSSRGQWVEEGMKIVKVPMPPQVKLGLDLYALSPKLAKALKVGSEIGLLVEDVKEDSLAQEFGIEVGDVLLQINEIKLASEADFEKAWQSLEEGRLILHYLRDGRILQKWVVLP